MRTTGSPEAPPVAKNSRASSYADVRPIRNTLAASSTRSDVRTRVPTGDHLEEPSSAPSPPPAWSPP